jgi:hypothetical protein
MLEYSLWLIADSRRLQDQSRRLALQQRAAFTTFIGQGIDMANTLLNVVVTSRDAQVKARCLAKVQQTYIRLSDLTQKTQSNEDLIVSLEGLRRRYEAMPRIQQ